MAMLMSMASHHIYGLLRCSSLWLLVAFTTYYHAHVHVHGSIAMLPVLFQALVLYQIDA